jgi:hypothetical protein
MGQKRDQEHDNKLPGIKGLQFRTAEEMVIPAQSVAMSGLGNKAHLPRHTGELYDEPRASLGCVGTQPSRPRL